jgi:isopenicillin-N epimerase
MNDFFDRNAWMLDPETLHLNHGSFGAVTKVVRREQDHWRRIAQANPNGFFTRVLADGLDAVRIKVADFVRTDPSAVLLQPNVTWAVATVLASFPLKAGDEVLITDDTYAAVRAAASDTCASTGAVLVQADLPAVDERDGAGIVAAVADRLSPRTRLAIVDHITSPTAIPVDPMAIVERCRANGTAVLIDGAHAPGMLSVDVRAIGADFYTGNFHKWCCAPWGSAFLAVAPQWRDAMRAAVPGSEAYRGFPAGLEWWGTADYSALLATPLALDTLADAGVDTLLQRNTALVNEGAALVAAALGQPPPAPASIAMITLQLPPRMASDIESARALRQRVADEIGAEIMTTMARGSAMLRLSAHAYNRLEDYERLAAVLSALQ